MVIMIDSSLSIETVMRILSCSKSYVYKLIKQGVLKPSSEVKPVRISISSVIAKISSSYPFIGSTCQTAIHYHVSQQAIPHA